MDFQRETPENDKYSVRVFLGILSFFGFHEDFEFRQAGEPFLNMLSHLPRVSRFAVAAPLAARRFLLVTNPLVAPH